MEIALSLLIVQVLQLVDVVAIAQCIVRLVVAAKK
jgi:hypothetical protein